MDTPWAPPPRHLFSRPAFACSDPLRYAEDSVNVDRAERHDIRTTTAADRPAGRIRATDMWEALW